MAERRVIGVLVSGRGSNLQAIFDAIAAGTLPVRVGIVISDKANAYALERAKQAGVPHLVVERKSYPDKQSFERAIDAALREAAVELVVLAGFMRILGSEFVRAWSGRLMNIHPALLPSFPGLDAQAQALAYGAKISGCTVHFVDEGVDSGPVILQQAVPVLPADTEETLSERILAQEHRLYPEAIKLWAEGRLIVAGRRVSIQASEKE